MKKNRVLLALILSTIVFSINAQIPPVDDDGLAIGGYDVVAYFSNNAVKGDEGITAKYKNATYQFSSKANRDLFQKSPTKYLPQFDGYCAWGIATKEAKYPINPETFDIVDGKLYLFFNGPFNGGNFNSMEPWNAETTILIAAAHKKWSGVK
ncbi:MAG: YHS domain-containing (seleno)protein [Reichenbachiella sp.]|uniref:YHS domain-containing (seleno)protein n=1 Tax=Reichenbachiella sp. TaxID=2184521 RepID=UPI00326693CC